MALLYIYGDILLFVKLYNLSDLEESLGVHGRNMKKLAKRLMNYTPYEIRRRRNFDAKNRSQDPLEHNTPEHMDDLFSDPDFLKKYKNDKRLALYEKIFEEFPPFWQSCVDAGCGPGFFLRFLEDYLSPRGLEKSLAGLEYSSKAVEIARHFSSKASIRQWNLEEKIDEKYDVVVCAQTLEHVHRPRKVYRNLLGALNSPGTLIITVPDGRQDYYGGHINFWSEESLHFFAEENGSGAIQKVTKISNEYGFDYLLIKIAI